MKIFLITEGNKKIGFGHITRCLSLYQAFIEKGYNPKFIINCDNSVLDLLNNCNYKILNWLKEKIELFNNIDNADIVIIDSYLADIKIYKRVSELAKTPIYFDDIKRLDYPQGIVINGSIGAKTLNYSHKKKTTYLLGTKYQPMRKAFWDVQEKEIQENIESIMITFGGNDIRNLTPKILKLFTNKYPDIKKNVIIGNGYTNFNDIEKVKDENTYFHYNLDDIKMKELMLSSDIAISASGQTLQELALIGVPTIVIAIADNQMNICKSWFDNGFIEFAGWWRDKNLIKNISHAIEKLKSKNTRAYKSNIGKSLIDGKGTERIINFVLN